MEKVELSDKSGKSRIVGQVRKKQNCQTSVEKEELPDMCGKNRIVKTNMEKVKLLDNCKKKVEFSYKCGKSKIVR